MCQTGVVWNAIFCGGCKRWVHKKCRGILRDPCALTLSSDVLDALVLSGLLMKEKLERLRLKTKSFYEFCYLGGHKLQMCMEQIPPIVPHPLLTNRHQPLLTRGQVYSSCVRSVMLHAAETWAMNVDTLNCLRRDPLDLQCQGKGQS